MSHSENGQALLGLTADIIAAHVKNNPVDAADLPMLIRQVHAALRQAAAPTPPAETTQAAEDPAPEPARQAPAVPARKSIFPDYIICLEDGRKMKTLKRYLRTTYNMTPEQYREKWGLQPDYPMVAPSYAEHRSALAKQTGLGRKTATSAAPPPADAAPATPAAEPDGEEPERESRSDHTAASVFSNFPRQAEMAEETEPAPGQGEERKPRRKPFSKQLARGMRR